MMTHLGICVADLERARAFYTEALECKEIGGIRTAGPTVDALLGLRGVDCDAIYLERDGFRLELLCYRSPGHEGDAEPRPMNLLGFTHLSVRVTDLDEVCARIEASGGTILRESEGDHPERGTRFLMATDPDGTRIELIQAPGDPSLIPQFPRRA
jgi:catechol 2,3-dioxygenase-like lactoylglutathione lyase family enzyme